MIFWDVQTTDAYNLNLIQVIELHKTVLCMAKGQTLEASGYSHGSSLQITATPLVLLGLYWPHLRVQVIFELTKAV